MACQLVKAGGGLVNLPVATKREDNMQYRIHRYTATIEHPQYYQTEYWRAGAWHKHGGKQAIKWASHFDAHVSLEVRVGNAAKLQVYLSSMATN